MTGTGAGVGTVLDGDGVAGGVTGATVCVGAGSAGARTSAVVACRIGEVGGVTAAETAEGWAAGMGEDAGRLVRGTPTSATVSPGLREANSAADGPPVRQGRGSDEGLPVP